MWAEVTSFIEVCFTGACLPATVLLILATLYWLLALIAGLDFDLFDFDFDFDVEPGDESFLQSTLGIGVAILQFLNIGRVPLILWGSVFAVMYWLVTLLFDRLLDDPASRTNLSYALQYTARNVVVGVMLAKGATQPLRGSLEPAEPNRAQDLIGRACHITTSEVTERFGQAQVPTEAAPLILDVRVKQAPLAKGDAAVIVDYDPDANVYFIEKAQTEV